MLCMTVNGKRVVIALGVHPGYRLNVDGSHWGYFDTVEIAVRAAMAVLLAPRFN